MSFASLWGALLWKSGPRMLSWWQSRRKKQIRRGPPVELWIILQVLIVVTVIALLNNFYAKIFKLNKMCFRKKYGSQGKLAFSSFVRTEFLWSKLGVILWGWENLHRTQRELMLNWLQKQDNKERQLNTMWEENGYCLLICNYSFNFQRKDKLNKNNMPVEWVSIQFYRRYRPTEFRNRPAIHKGDCP